MTRSSLMYTISAADPIQLSCADEPSTYASTFGRPHQLDRSSAVVNATRAACMLGRASRCSLVTPCTFSYAARGFDHQDHPKHSILCGFAGSHSGAAGTSLLPVENTSSNVTPGVVSVLRAVRTCTGRESPYATTSSTAIIAVVSVAW